MKTSTIITALFLSACSLALPAAADQGNTSEARCKEVSGHAFWTLIPASNDLFGRVMGSSTGDLKAAVTAYIVEPPSGDPHVVLTAHTSDIWVFSPTDMLAFDGHVSFKPVPGPFGAAFYDTLLLTVQPANSTGIYAGATGQVTITGIAYNLLTPGAFGSAFADVSYKGNICRLR